MKKKIIVIGIIFLISILSISGCIRPTTGIGVKKLNRTPSKFINMTEEQMQLFPLLKEAVQTNKLVEVASPSDEIEQLYGIFRYFDTRFICYQNEYYEISIHYAD